MNANEGADQLDWLAFCYVAGELPPAEAEQFEARLADDQAAREALARAVELTQTVVAAEAQSEILVAPARRYVAGWGTRLSWMAIGGLASIVVALLWSGALHNSTSGPSEKQIALAAAWTQTRADIAQANEDEMWLPPVWMLGEADEELLAVTDASLEPLPGETPSWLTAAVFLAGENAEPFTNERGEN
jgi:hypothetical protein